MSKEPVRVTTAVGRLINSSFWDKEVYKDERGREGTPAYKMEMAFESEDDITELEDAIVAAAVEEWGEGAEAAYYDEGTIRSPILVGDDLADAREKKGKSGDAYRGKFVVRASTIFNLNGDDGPGGVYVCDENAVEIDFAGRGKVYNGCNGIAVVEPQCYLIDGRKGVTLYLKGFQFVSEGERLRGSDPSSLFKPMVSEGSEGKGRRGRRGGK